MDISEIRRQNLLLLIDRYKTQVEFANEIGKPASYISQIKKGGKKNGEKVSMGNEMARDIEKALNLEHGWLDTYQNDNKPGDKIDEYSNLIIIGNSAYPPVKIEYLDMCASCGPGYCNDDYPKVFSQYLTVEFLRENGLPIDGKGVKLMHACGDSMWHTVPNGTVILVNTNENSFDNFVSNRVYVFNANGEMICKRAIKNIDGSITLKSDNPDKTDYPDIQVNRSNFNNLTLVGRVRYVFMQM